MDRSRLQLVLVVTLGRHRGRRRRRLGLGLPRAGRGRGPCGDRCRGGRGGAVRVVRRDAAGHLASYLRPSPRRDPRRPRQRGGAARGVWLAGRRGGAAARSTRRRSRPARCWRSPRSAWSRTPCRSLLLTNRREASLNMRGAYLEVLGDLLGSALVVVAALVIMATGFERADPLASLLIAVLILPRSFRLLRDAVNVLLETTPRAPRPRGRARPPRRACPASSTCTTCTPGRSRAGCRCSPRTSRSPTSASSERGVGSLLDEFSGCVASHFAVDHATFQIEPAEPPRPRGPRPGPRLARQPSGSELGGEAGGLVDRALRVELGGDVGAADEVARCGRRRRGRRRASAPTPGRRTPRRCRPRAAVARRRPRRAGRRRRRGRS